MDDQTNTSIDRVLAALRNAPPPDGIEERIIQRMHLSETSSRTLRWRDLLTGSALAGAWWRGALTGAAFAGVAVAAALSLHPGRAAVLPGPQVASTHIQSLTAQPAAVHPVFLPQPRCAPQEILRVYTAPPPAETAAPASTRRTRPAPELALTDQERALLRLAHSANAAQLVSLDRENIAKVDAEREASFKSFFAPPPEPVILTAPTETPNTNSDTPPNEPEKKGDI